MFVEFISPARFQSLMKLNLEPPTAIVNAHYWQQIIQWTGTMVDREQTMTVFVANRRRNSYVGQSECSGSRRCWALSRYTLLAVV